MSAKGAGTVYIVGAGPGAHDLITLRGLAVLRTADVVFYDALISPRILEEARPGAERVFVGKRCGHHHTEEQQICGMLVEKAREGKTVVRLKGGDPMIYGRGGEEALACAEARVPFEIVPGICSALGAASYAGIPLTHRGTASSVAFVTAHSAGSADSPDTSWQHLAKAVDTLVIFMGGAWVDAIAASLVRAGLAPDTPVAVVSHATAGDQQTLLGSLATIAARVADARLPNPMLIVVGEVTRLSETLNWFERGSRASLPVATVASSAGVPIGPRRSGTAT
ncbi:MAG TPA: uroporphyrinogen-III C-methyltransferase [bacterium]|nr:uroporphyrinogen-III C-methyltransferase [bacterium]